MDGAARAADSCAAAVPGAGAVVDGGVCGRGLYTGWTNNLEKRIKDHNAGRGAKYTKARRPVVLVYKEEFPTKQEAMKREWEIKRLSRKEKLSMIENSKS